MPVNVGFLLATNRSDWAGYLARFKRTLKNRGNGNKAKIFPRKGAGGEFADVLAAATALANDPQIKVIVTAGTMGAQACKQATATNQKPFVYASIGDPALTGLTPTGNFTGGSNGQVKYVPERVKHMTDNPIFVNKFAVVGNYNNEPVKTAMNDARQKLIDKGKQVVQLSDSTLTPNDDIEDFIARLEGLGVKSLYCCSDLWLTVNSTELNVEAHAAGMKTMWEIEDQKLVHRADDACGVSFDDMFDKAAEYADKLCQNIPIGTLPLFEPPLSHVHLLKKPTKKSPPRRPKYKAQAKKRPAAAKKKKARPRR